MSDENAQTRYTGAIPKNFQLLSPNFLMESRVENLPREFNSVVDLINEGIRVCVILRGLPGSGKSFIAYQLLEKTVKGSDPKIHIFSADQFFINNRGQYHYIQEKIKEAHETAQRGFAQHAAKGVSPLIADNTHLEKWEMYSYVKAANYYNYKIVVLEPETPWKANDVMLSKRNQHSVPLDRIKIMKKKYEKIWSPDQLLYEINVNPCQPKVRCIPPPPELPKPAPVITDDLIKFDDIRVVEMITLKNESPAPEERPLSQKLQVARVFEDEWDGLEKASTETEKVPELKLKTEPQPQRELLSPEPDPAKLLSTQSKNSTKLVPHKKNCPNENPSFAQLRELYSNVNEESLFDYFKVCGGDANYCAEQLMDNDVAEPMNRPGNSLTCDCSNPKKPIEPRVAKVKVEETKEQQSPVVKVKKSKPIDLDEWLQTKKTIEESIKIGDEHFPEHVKTVKKWKQGPAAAIIEETTIKSRSESPSSGENIPEELHALSIPEELILELDQEYGGGLIKDTNDGAAFPPKIFIKKSVAHQLYLEIMEAFYSRREETRRNTEQMQLKEDEKLAQKLNEEFNGVPTKPQWAVDNESEDDFALRISKERLVELFPNLEREALMSIFAGCDHKFEKTVDVIQDSLNCTKEEREMIKKAKKKIFNSQWKQPKKEEVNNVKKKAPTSTNAGAGYTEEHLKTVEDLRQEIQEHREEQAVCRNRAQEAIQKKQYELATYFSNIARFHKLKAEESTHIVANLVSSIHENTQSSASVLDLHYHNMKEAETLLETFLDRNIMRLRDIKKPYQELFIITGRGAHSANGVAMIKNSTKSILKRRGLKFDETNNPGMLSCKITNSSKLSNELESEQQ